MDGRGVVLNRSRRAYDVEVEMVKSEKCRTRAAEAEN